MFYCPVAPTIRRFLFVGVTLAITVLSGCPTLTVVELAPTPLPGDRHLLRFAHITDPQIVDEESPARMVRFTDLTRGAWRPQEAYGVHTLDATLQAINRIHHEVGPEGRPVDFVMVTGDLADSAQRNELQWFIDTMDGALVQPDSGRQDGLQRDVPFALNPKLPYDAVGLDPDIPWYTCFGNHDGLAVGTFPIDRSLPQASDWSAPLIPLVAELNGLHNVGFWTDSLRATSYWSPAVLLGSGVPLRPDGYQLDLTQLSAGPIAQDSARQFLSKADFIDLHIASSSLPRGHGFTDASREAGATCYSTRPLADVPLRLIVFDSVAADSPFGLPAHLGVLSRAHFDSFLVPALNAARAADEWVIVVSHHPSADFNDVGPADRVQTQEFRDTLSTYPNVIMHLNGHTHRHRTELVPGPSPYLEVGTTAIIDYPQEGRLLDIILEQDGSIRVESHIFGHMEAPTAFSAESFRISMLDAEQKALEAVSKGEQSTPITPGPYDRNFQLRLPRAATQPPPGSN